MRADKRAEKITEAIGDFMTWPLSKMQESQSLQRRVFWCVLQFTLYVPVTVLAMAALVPFGLAEGILSTLYEGME